MASISRQESQDSSSLSDATTNLTGADITSDEDVMCSLAINKPKKRAGRKIFKETRHPIYRGVRKRNGDKWVCELREPNKKTRIWLGTYPTLEMAARAHDVAALALRGKSACLNFADSAWRLPVPASGDPAEIRRVAAEAAEMFRPEEFGGFDRNNEVEDLSEDLFSSNVDDENVKFIDEEEEFEMPRLMEQMAQGLLLSPPSSDFSTSDHWSCLDYDYNVSLWSYSFNSPIL